MLLFIACWTWKNRFRKCTLKKLAESSKRTKHDFKVLQVLNGTEKSLKVSKILFRS